jgi:CHASE1-domain containing sensor protein
MSLIEMQVLFALLTASAMLSAAWLVLHARDVALLLRQAFPLLLPGKGVRLASFKAVSAGLAVFGFSIAGEVWMIARAAA